MKNLSILLSLLLSFNLFAAEDINLRFWDGTFAYNQLIVKSHSHQDNILTLSLSGSQINLGAQLEGLGETWSSKDLVEITLRKSDCTVDVEGMRVNCKSDRLLATVRWTVNSTITKTFHGLVNNLNVAASKQVVSFNFKMETTDDFQPHNEDISVTFFGTHF